VASKTTELAKGITHAPLVWVVIEGGLGFVEVVSPATVGVWSETLAVSTPRRT
jgi:hypothetical protein